MIYNNGKRCEQHRKAETNAFRSALPGDKGDNYNKLKYRAFVA